MGFGTEQSRATFVGIFKGKLTIRAKEGDEGAVMRENKNGDKVWEFHHPNFTGTLINVECIKHEKMGYQYVVSLDDVGSLYKLSIAVESKYGDNFISKLLSIKRGQLITLSPYEFEKDGSKNTGISITVNGEKIPALITKDNPMDRPQPESANMDEDDWKAYMIKVRKYYRGIVDRWQQEQVATNKPTAAPQQQTSSIEDAIGSANEPSDLGF